MLSVFSCPSRYTQGKNATQVLGQEMVILVSRSSPDLSWQNGRQNAVGDVAQDLGRFKYLL